MCMRKSGKSHHVGVVTSVAGRLAVKLASQLIAQLRRVTKMFLYRYYPRTQESMENLSMGFNDS